MTKDKQMYRVFAQKEGITITAETSESTFEEVKETAVVNVLGGVDRMVEFQPYVIVPITTKERWKNGFINFCPRCGANVADQEHENYAFFDCFDCNSSMEVQIHHNEDDEE